MVLSSNSTLLVEILYFKAVSGFAIIAFNKDTFM